MENASCDYLLYSELVELHRRRTEAELMGYRTKAYDALIAFYKMKLPEIERGPFKENDSLTRDISGSVGSSGGARANN
jgi:hypothetical protein